MEQDQTRSGEWRSSIINEETHCDTGPGTVRKINFIFSFRPGSGQFAVETQTSLIVDWPI